MYEEPEPTCEESDPTCVEPEPEISEIDIALLAPTSASWSYTDTPSLVPPGTVSLRYVALHELGHAIGLIHDNQWPSDLEFGTVNNVMDTLVPNGGDFGGPVPGTSGSGLRGILRVTGGELWALAAAMGDTSTPGSVYPHFAGVSAGPSLRVTSSTGGTHGPHPSR